MFKNVYHNRFRKLSKAFVTRCKCNLVASQIRSPRSGSEVHNDTSRCVFCRCSHLLKFVHPEANLRYTTILCNARLVAAYILPIVFSASRICSSGSQSEVHNNTLQRSHFILHTHTIHFHYRLAPCSRHSTLARYTYSIHLHCIIATSTYIIYFHDTLTRYKYTKHRTTYTYSVHLQDTLTVYMYTIDSR